jgi:tRNA (guanine-N7-)-methyltransferase
MSGSLSHGKTLDVGQIGRTMDDLPSGGLTAPESRFDFRQWWPADRRSLPYELEIGSGKGTFLVQQASQLADVNYLGIEWAKEFWRYAADRLRRHGLDHVRMLHGDATEFVSWFCPDAMFRQVHLYFSDPWPKKRHHKRRVFQAPFLRQLHRVLVESTDEQPAMIRVVTDHEDYWTWMQQHAAEVSELFDVQPFERPVAAGEGEVVGTNFERKYRREGRPFHAMTLMKKPIG